MDVIRKRLSHLLMGVSRTFSLNIQNLSGSLYDSVLVSYLVCRLFDTVEDSRSLSVEKKCELLNFLEDCFVKGCTQDVEYWSGKVQKWGDRHLYITELIQERNLIKDVGLLWKFFQVLPKLDRECIVKPICEMSQGMSWFIREYSKVESSPKVLKNQEHFRKYCHVVAGTVGNLLTGLFLNRIKVANNNLHCIKNLGISFGHGLQMTNILKDTFVDATRGWVYLPKTVFEKFGLNVRSYLQNQHPQKNVLVLDQMIRHTKYSLKKGFLYIQNIPVAYQEIRSFCMIALFLSLKTLKELKNNTFFKEEVYRNKISRTQVKKVLFWIPFCSRSNTVFRFLYSRWARL